MFKEILKLQKEIKENDLETRSIRIILNASLQLKNLDNIELVYSKCLKGSEFVTWRSLEACLRVYARLGYIRTCQEIYQLYKSKRVQAAEEYNTKYNLKRPEYKDLENSGLFSRLYMLPEPPRTILYQMAYVYGYNRDLENIKRFFKEEVFEKSRLQLYHLRKKMGLAKDMKSGIQKAQEKIDNIKSHHGPKTLIRNYKDNISKFNKTLKRSNKHFDVGFSGPVEIVYQGLIDGWKIGIEDFEGRGTYLVEMDEVINELEEMERSLEKEFGGIFLKHKKESAVSLLSN